MCRRSWLCFVPAAVLMLLLGSGVPGQSLSDAEQRAISIAWDFFGRAGVSVAQDAEVNILPPKEEWPAGTIGVRFGGGFEVGVDSANGRVLWFRDSRVPGPDVLVEKDEALTLAQQCLAAAGGLPGPARFEGVSLERFGPEIAVWIASWRRRVGEYDCDSDGAGVVIAADTGRLAALGIVWEVQPPESLEPNITRERAIQLARVYAETDAPVRSVKLAIRRDWRKVGPGSGARPPFPGVLTWSVSFDDPKYTGVVLSAVDGALFDVGEVAGAPASGGQSGDQCEKD